jgi:hypothetical protein
MGKKKILRRLGKNYGAIPDIHYFAGDMQNITSYFDYRREHGLDDFLLDERRPGMTWTWTIFSGASIRV